MRAGLPSALAVLVLALAGCGGADSSSEETPSAATSETGATTAPAVDPEAVESARVYAAKMKPLAADLLRALQGADVRRNRRDFDRGIALLDARKRMARITADPALLLAHDRLAKAAARAGTLLVAEPGSELARGATAAGTPPGTQTAVLLAAPAVDAWATETAGKLREVGAEVPAWLDRTQRAARRLNARALAAVR